MALCEVDDPVFIRDQVEAFLRTQTPAERQEFVLFFGSFMQRQLRSTMGRDYQNRINSGSWSRRKAGGELSIVREEIIDPKTQLIVGRINRLAHCWTDGSNLSLSIIQEERGPFLTLNQIQVVSPDQTITHNPTSDQS